MSWPGLGEQGLGGWIFSSNFGWNHHPRYKGCSLGGKIKTEYTKLASLGDLAGQGLGWFFLAKIGWDRTTSHIILVLGCSLGDKIKIPSIQNWQTELQLTYRFSLAQKTTK